MHPDLRIVMSLAGLLVTAAQAGEGTASRRAYPCPQDAPEGVRFPDRPDCAARKRPEARETDGFRDVGGVRRRVGGRVSADYGFGR